MNKESGSLTKTVLITGAAGGLGSVLVRKYAGLGFQVYGVDINSQGLDQLNGISGVITKTLDVTDSVKVDFFVKQIELEKRGLDILVCLAGIYETYPVTEANPDLFKKIISVNLHGTATLVQACLGALVKVKGRVIVVSSESYKIQAMFQPYMVSKAALEAYCRVARQELALKDVKFTVIRPGAIRTPLLNWMKAGADSGKYPVFNLEFRKSWQQSIKLVGKITSPEKVAQKILSASISANPKRIYRINNNPLLTLISLLPDALTDNLIVRMFKMKG